MTEIGAKEQAAAMTRELMPYVNTLLLAQVHAQVQREKMDALDRRLLAESEYLSQFTGARITDPAVCYHMSEADGEVYYARRQMEIDAMGYTLPRGYCPALMAEQLRRQAEHLLIEAAGAFYPQLSVDALLCGGLDAYGRFIELVTDLVVNGPGYEPPQIPRPTDDQDGKGRR